MADLGKLALDPTKVDGAWVTYPGTDIEFRIRRIGNPDYQADFTRMARNNRRELRYGGGELNMKKMQAALMAKHILVDWRNVAETNDAGELIAVPYSEERARGILQDERFDEIYQFVLEVAADNQIFLDESMETDAGNSPDSSGGKGETS